MCIASDLETQELLIAKLQAKIGGYYHLLFFTAHEEIGERAAPVDEALLARYQSPAERSLITRAVRLSHEFELLFYDTVKAVSPETM
ncbi:MAG TPA: hypothetical protein VKV19_19070 [Ktedonobacteraceae bacterium]|nr:hypothetical protein [Ktedonobacteraceae bacterium]